jgi:hypothetical protein
MKSHDDAIRDRLRRLLRDHNQAKLARATGRSRNALTRYMQGAKLPMSFGAALVDELGVNPAWLLRGDEPMYLADVPAAAGELGGELLELMRALDQVAKLKLGALTGSRHAQALRELSGTLDRYGSLRDRLNRIAAPVLTELLAQAEQASNQRQLDRAQALVKAAYRVQQFCDDRELAQRLISAQAVMKQIEQDSEEALRLQMSVFQQRMSLDATFVQIAEPAAGLSQVLRSNLYARKAQRVTRVALGFAQHCDEGSEGWVMLQGQHAMACVELGEYDGVSAALDVAVSCCPPRQRPLIDAAKYFHDLNRGIWTARELAGGRPNSFAATAMLLNAAYCTDDAELVEQALHGAREVMQAQMPLNRFIVARAERVLKTMRGAKIPHGALEAFTGRGPTSEFTAAVPRAQLLRLARDRRAPAEMLHAQACLDQYPADRTPNPFHVGLHIRNVLASVPTDTRDARLHALRVRVTEIAAARVVVGHGLLAGALASSDRA